MTRPTPAQLDALQRIAAADDRGRTIYVYRDPTRPGPIRATTLTALLRNGWVELGDYVLPRGRPVHLTPAGRAAGRAALDG